MRKTLKAIGNQTRHTFTATFARFGTKNGYMGIEKTVLLQNIKDENGNLISDHLWFNYTTGFAKLRLKEGMHIQFNARVAEYEKGYKGYREDVYVPIEIDYKLSYPTKIKII